MIDRIQTNVEDVKKKHSAILSAPQTDESEFNLSSGITYSSASTCILLSRETTNELHSGLWVISRRQKAFSVKMVSFTEICRRIQRSIGGLNQTTSCLFKYQRVVYINNDASVYLIISIISLLYHDQSPSFIFDNYFADESQYSLSLGDIDQKRGKCLGRSSEMNQHFVSRLIVDPSRNFSSVEGSLGVKFKFAHCT